MTDTAAPKLLDFKLSQLIDLSQPGAGITFELEAADEAGGSGLSYVNIVLDRFVNGGTMRKHVVFRAGDSSADGQIVGTDTFMDGTPNTAASFYNVGPGTPGGTVRIAYISLADHAGHATVYSAEQLKSLGFNATVTLINSSAPPAPTAALAGTDTSTAARALEGTGQVGTTIYVAGFVAGAWVNIGTTLVGTDGKWAMQATQLADGVYDQVSAWAVDANGNASSLSSQFSFDIWKDGLGPPSFTLPVDSQGLLRTDNPVITGKGTPQALVTIFADGKAVGAGRVDSSGNWAILSETLSNGNHSFTASQSTAGGSTSSESQPTQAIVNVQDTSGLKFLVSSLSVSGATADRAFIQNMLDDTAARISEFIDINATVPVNVSVADLGHAVATAGARWLGTDSDGTPILGDAVLELSSRYPSLYAQSESVNPYLFAHEMLHALGINSGVSAFKSLIQTTSDGVFFTGPNAMAINGGPVRLSSDNAHIDDISDLMSPGGGSLDSPAFGASNPLAPFSTLNVAILKDLGWKTKPVLVSADGHTFVAGSGKLGFDQVDGTNGLDTFFINESRAKFAGSWQNGEYLISSAASGTSHSLNGIERINFADATVALDVDGVAGQVYRLYEAVFGRTPDKAGLGFWIRGVDNGLTIAQVADQFAASAEFKSLYGTDPSAEHIVTKLYANVLHRAPDQGGYDFWLPIIQNDPSMVEEVLVAFSESAENKEQVAKIIGNGFEYEPYG